jgi:signal transduction histidine kinase
MVDRPTDFVEEDNEPSKHCGKERGRREFMRVAGALVASPSFSPSIFDQDTSNPFSNAIKFTPSGGNVKIELESSGVTLEVSALHFFESSCPVGPGHVTFSIMDWPSGTGNNGTCMHANSR